MATRQLTSASNQSGSVSFPQQLARSGYVRGDFSIPSGMMTGSVGVAMGDARTSLSYSITTASNTLASLTYRANSNAVPITRTASVSGSNLTSATLGVRVRGGSVYCSVGSNGIIVAENLLDRSTWDFDPQRPSSITTWASNASAPVTLTSLSYQPVMTVEVPIDAMAGIRAADFINLPIASTSNAGIVMLNTTVPSMATMVSTSNAVFQRVAGADIAASNAVYQAGVANSTSVGASNMAGVAIDQARSAFNIAGVSITQSSLASDTASAASNAATAASNAATAASNAAYTALAKANAATTGSTGWAYVNAGPGEVSTAAGTVRLSSGSALRIGSTGQPGATVSATGGMLSVAADTNVAISVAGNPRFSADTGGGNLNIANSAPVMRWSSQGTWLNDRPLYLRSLGDKNHGLYVASAVDGPAIIGNGGGLLGTPSSSALYWNSSGNVGIGWFPNNTYKMTVDGNLCISGKNVLELNGAGGLSTGPAKEANSGKIAYSLWSSGLDIVGGGTTAGQRLVYLYDNVSVNGSITTKGNATIGGSITVASTNQTISAYGYLNSGGSVGYISGANIVPVSITCSGRVICPEFNAVSDRRMKDDIETLHDDICATAVSQLQPRKYVLRKDGCRKTGFIAQEVAGVLPSAVSTMKHEGYDDFHMLDHNQIVAVLCGAVRQLQNKVSHLEEQCG